MMTLRDNVGQSIAALKQHKLRSALTMVGLTMGVATLITVMTLVQGANRYVEQKIARLGNDVFQIAKTPFVATDFNEVIKSLKYKNLYLEDVRAVEAGCQSCEYVGAQANATVRVQSGNKILDDITMFGHTPNMSILDSRTVERGRYFTEAENNRSAYVCLIGADIAEQFFTGYDPIGKTIRVDNQEFNVIGTLEKIGSVLGQNQDNILIAPLNTYLRMKGNRNTVVINVKAAPGPAFERAQDEARMVLRARRHIGPKADEDFFFGTKESFMTLWASISAAFFAVFIMVSSISAVVGGIVIMNVMLVSVTERTKEIGIRRALGATKDDIRGQFLTESVIQCVIGGAIGIGIGFGCALALRAFTSFPASVQIWVAILGVVLSSGIGLFFGIYPASRAARLDPVVALRSE